MGLFVSLYGHFRACLKRVVLVPVHGPRPRPKPGPALKYSVSCRVWAVFFFRAYDIIKTHKCTPIFVCLYDIYVSTLKNLRNIVDTKLMTSNFVFLEAS
jgi:hypothetical protein